MDQRFARHRRAVGKRLELQPAYVRIDRVKVGESGKAAVSPGDKIARADDVGKPLEPLSDHLGMLDIIGARVDNTRDEDLAFGQAVLL